MLFLRVFCVSFAHAFLRPPHPRAPRVGADCGLDYANLFDTLKPMAQGLVSLERTVDPSDGDIDLIEVVGFMLDTARTYATPHAHTLELALDPCGRAADQPAALRYLGLRHLVSSPVALSPKHAPGPNLSSDSHVRAPHARRDTTGASPTTART